MTEPEKNPLDMAARADPELALKPDEPTQNWVKIGVDYGPIIAFGLTYVIAPHVAKFSDKEMPLIWASGVLAAASVIAVIVGFFAEKRIAWIPLVTAILGIPFAVLTVVFKDGMFIKIKMTIIDAIIAGILLGGLALKKQPLKALLGDALKLRDEAWPRMTIYYALFYLAMAVVNVVVWLTQPEKIWFAWKMGSMIGGPILFSIVLLPFMMKNLIMDEATAAKSSGSK